MNYGWTSTKKCWKQLSAAIGARSWKRVPFNKIEKIAVPECGGVYVFCARPNTKDIQDPKHLLRTLFNAVYVGQAKNLRTRFESHWRNPMIPMEAVRDCFSHNLEFWFIKLDSPEELCKVERILIECLGPVANRQAGPGLKGKLGVGQPA